MREGGFRLMDSTSHLTILSLIRPSGTFSRREEENRIKSDP
jgi:hypothetical protein